MGKKRLKVVFLSRYVGQVNRGVESYVLELSQRLAKNHWVEVLSGQNADSFKKIITGNYDVVIPTNGRIQSLKASLGRVFGGYKTIISGQAGIGKDDIWNILITLPDVYVALTDFELQWAKKWAIVTKLVKIPNGADLKKFSPTGPMVKIDLPPPVVLSVGALEWYKHHDLTIDAMSSVPTGSLLIIGSGREYQRLLQMGNEKLGRDRFKIISVNFNEIPNYYRAAQLFTLPSWDREAFGIVYVEAMACGLPVVAPNDPPRKEIIGQAGILVDVKSKSQYADAIEQALTKKWGNRAQKQAEKFSWDKIAQNYENLFQEIIR